MISIQALREKAHSLMTNGMRNSPGLFDRRNDKLNRTLPVYLAEPNDRQSRQELPHRINQWIDEKKGLIAQLSAPLGQGKTIATCTLQRQLQRIYPDKVCV
jgi:pantothenate kinase-related protein Tda10